MTFLARPKLKLKLTNALPLSYASIEIMGEAAGFEPATFGFIFRLQARLLGLYSLR